MTPPHSPTPSSSPFDQQIRDCATLYALDTQLLRAQVFAESSFDAYAFRYEDAFFERYIRGKPAVKGHRYGPLAACSYGLLQIMLETALELGFDGPPHQLFDPRVGLSWGAQYLVRCLDATNHDYFLAVARYNGRGQAARLYAEKVYRLAGRDIPIDT